MKKNIIFFTVLLFTVFAQENSEISYENEETLISSEDIQENEAEKEFIYTREVQIPLAKRPLPPDPQKASEAQTRDDDNSAFEKKQKAIRYGTPSEINKIVDEVLKEEDPRFSEDFYDLFQETQNNSIRSKIFEYFSKHKDPCLEDYAVELLDDPYDAPSSLLEKIYNYVSEVECKDAAPALVKILEGGDETYFNGALFALGKTGGEEEAVYLAEYLKKDDLTTAQRQVLMRTLGQMNVKATWQQLTEIIEDEDENNFVRMYAAEAIGIMQIEDSIPILVDMFEKGDPNMRQYCIKGLSNYPSSQEAKDTIIQGIRDDHYKVRLEAVEAVKKLKMTEAAEYLIFRAEKDSEKAVKSSCYSVIASLDCSEGNQFLLEKITEKKVNDSVRAQAAKVLIENGSVGESEIVDLARQALKDNKRKSLYYALGKLFIKYARPGYSEICAEYLKSKDNNAVAQGLEMFKNGGYESARSFVQDVADAKEIISSSNKKRAAKLLGIEE